MSAPLPPSTAKLVASVAKLVCDEDATAFRLMRLADAIEHAHRRCTWLLLPHGDYGKCDPQAIEAAISAAILGHLADQAIEAIQR